MTTVIKNLDAASGAEVTDIDLSKPLPRADIDAIEAAWRERLVVVFHGQPLSDRQLIAFSRNFGELDPPGPNPYGQPFNKEHPELNVIPSQPVSISLRRAILPYPRPLARWRRPIALPTKNTMA
jgi:taurine dioxygenase